MGLPNPIPAGNERSAHGGQRPYRSPHRKPTRSAEQYGDNPSRDYAVSLSRQPRSGLGWGPSGQAGGGTWAKTTCGTFVRAAHRGDAAEWKTSERWQNEEHVP